MKVLYAVTQFVLYKRDLAVTVCWNNPLDYIINHSLDCMIVVNLPFHRFCCL